MVNAVSLNNHLLVMFSRGILVRTMYRLQLYSNWKFRK